MESNVLDQAIKLLEKANANLEPELLTAPVAREVLAAYARAERLSSSAISPTPTLRSCPVQGKGGQSDPNWSCS